MGAPVNVPCLPAFILAGQSNMLGLGMLGFTANETEAALRIARQARSASSMDVWSVGYRTEPNPASMGRTSTNALRCADWAPLVPTAVEQRALCVPGSNQSRLDDRAKLGCHESPRVRAPKLPFFARCQGGPGPEVGFAETLAKQADVIPNRAFGIIKAALGGSAMSDWAPDNLKVVNAAAPNTSVSRDGRLWQHLRAILQAALLANFTDSAGQANVSKPTCVSVRGLVWMQGEKEQAHTGTAGFLAAHEWAATFLRFVDGVRHLAGSPNMAVVVARSLPSPPRNNGTLYLNPRRQAPNSFTVRAQQIEAVHNLTARGIAASWVDLDDLTFHRDIVAHDGFKDVVHLDYPGLYGAGARFANAMASLLRRSDNP